MESLNRRELFGIAALGASVGSFTAIETNAGAEPLQIDPQFEAWLSKIKGSHRQVFDAPKANDGMPFAWSLVFMMMNEKIGVKNGDTQSVLVLRHDAIPLAMQSPLWAKYKLGERFEIKDHVTKEAATRNPFYKPKQGELPLPGMSVEDLLKAGVLIGVCDLAITFNTMRMAKDLGVDAGKLKQEFVDAIIPGIVRVPAGILAINRAQERKCTYCFAG